MATSFEFPLFYGFFSVTATDPSGSVMVTKSDTINITQPSVPLQVSCPTVAEPNIPYKCGFASIPGTGNLLVTYPENGGSHALSPFGKIDFFVHIYFQVLSSHYQVFK